MTLRRKIHFIVLSAVSQKITYYCSIALGFFTQSGIPLESMDDDAPLEISSRERDLIGD